MAISTRPGPDLAEPAGAAAGSGAAVDSSDGAVVGSGAAVGSDMDDRPDLMQPDHQHGRDEPGHGDDRRAPP